MEGTMVQAWEWNGGVRFRLDEPFSLKDTFTCGQAFRFYPTSDGGYGGIALGRRVSIVPRGDGSFFLFPCSLAEFQSIWRSYFDLDRSYSAVMEALWEDVHVRRGMEYAPGIRILNQDPFETTISFIISANNNMKRIMSLVEALSRRWGAELPDGGFAFPVPEVLASLDPLDLRRIGMGYRAEYVVGTARMAANGFDLKALMDLDLPEARAQLCRLPGVGPKVADCILMFALHHRDAFPVDTWVKKVLVRLYPQCDLHKPQVFAQAQYGNLAGYANQYLFHCIRSVGEAAFCGGSAHPVDNRE
jgi:N-glycosylase/DNA lyase